MSFPKSSKQLFLYIGLLIASIAVFLFWLVFIVSNSATQSGDIILLSFMFAVVFFLCFTMLFLYFRQPKVVISVENETIIYHKSTKNEVRFHLLDINTFSSFQSHLAISTKDNKMTIVRFLKAPHMVRETLSNVLNTYIKDNPERYFGAPM